MNAIILPISVLIIFCASFNASAEEPFTAKAVVLEVLAEEEREIPGLPAKANYQTLRVEMLDGPKKGESAIIENDFLNLKKGDIFYLNSSIAPIGGDEIYTVADVYRINSLIIFALLFVALVFVFGRGPGTRGLLSLIGSLALIIFVLLPGILKGYSPTLLSIFVGSIIVSVGSYITHGFSKTTTVAILGITATIALTGALANFAVGYSRLSGFSDHESVYLNLNTGGEIDFAGLLLAGIMIGLLGILYDAAIGQAVAVEELYSAGAHLSKNEILKKALRIGREHIGALVNTLAIAYVGAALPLLLLFYLYQAPLVQTINREIFAAEILRILIGSIGLILTVPITTFLAVFILEKSKIKSNQ